MMAYMAKRSRNSKRTYWQRIGRAFPHDTGAGLTVLLDALPLDGRIILLELDERDHRRLLAEAAEFGDISNEQKRSGKAAKPSKP